MFAQGCVFPTPLPVGSGDPFPFLLAEIHVFRSLFQLVQERVLRFRQERFLRTHNADMCREGTLLMADIRFLYSCLTGTSRPVWRRLLL